MPRPVTMFTGQWADMPLRELAAKAAEWGFDGLELACWGDHFEVDRALSEDGYCQGRLDLLAEHDLKCYSISNHLVGQAVSDPIDERHKAIVPERIWGDGSASGVQTPGPPLRGGPNSHPPSESGPSVNLEFPSILQPWICGSGR